MRPRPPKPSLLASGFRPSPAIWDDLHVPGYSKPLSPDGVRVIVCEPDHSLRSDLVNQLLIWGFAVEGFETSEAALECLETNGPKPRILITALHIEDFPGVELARVFARAIPDIEVVISATNLELPFALEVKGTRISEVLIKPVLRMEDLRVAVSNCLLRSAAKDMSQKLIRDLEKHEGRLEIEAGLAEELSESVDSQKVLKAGVQGLSELFDGAPVVYFNYDANKRAISAGARCPMRLFAGTDLTRLIPQSALSLGLAGIQNWLKSLESEPSFQESCELAARMQPEFAVGLGDEFWRVALVETRGIPRGILVVKPLIWNERLDRMRFERLARTLAKSLEIGLLHAKIAEISPHEPYTGLLNGKFFKTRLAEEVSKASRLKHPVSVLCVRAPGLKGAASDFEKATGVRLFGTLVRNCFRNTDLIAMDHEGHFLVALPHTSFVDALGKAEKTVSQAREALGALATSVSCGVAEYPGHASRVEELLFAAENAAVEAVTAGKLTGVAIADIRSGYIPPFLPETPRTQVPLK
jgi:diguanylate cyclase (GGDEF)-like protein